MEKFDLASFLYGGIIATLAYILVSIYLLPHSLK